jgi:hypothetical protein
VVNHIHADDSDTLINCSRPSHIRFFPHFTDIYFIKDFLITLFGSDFQYILKNVSDDKISYKILHTMNKKVVIIGGGMAGLSAGI